MTNNRSENNIRLERGGASSCRFLMALILLLESAHGFSAQPPSVSFSPRVPTAMKAISIPIDDFMPTGSRKNRVQQVLQRARARTDASLPIDTRPTNHPQPPTPSSTPHTSAASPLPFVLPTLTSAQQVTLENNQVVMEQSEMGRQGQGFMVQDIDCNEETVWNVLLDFERYTEHIHTVRSATVHSDDASSQQRKYGSPSITRASFDVSKFHFTIGAQLEYRPEHNYMELSLDNGLQNKALQHARGIWYTQQIGHNKTRVWLLCDLTVSSLLPSFVVHQAAQSAMPRASSWLRPTIAALQNNA